MVHRNFSKKVKYPGIKVVKGRMINLNSALIEEQLCSATNKTPELQEDLCSLKVY